ncbi:MAG TPA: hypothetical protein VMY37_33140, partial [Thermoguttaceae bacterium]|nr:hypothetical protein [Thermoguttaceae bacterium]
IGTSQIGPNDYLLIELRNYGRDFARTTSAGCSGTAGILALTQYEARPDSGGNISVCVDGNEIISPNLSLAIGAAGVPGVSRSSNVVTVTTVGAHGFSVGQTVVISGVTDSSFDGTFQVATVPSTTTFTYVQTGSDTTSGGGTAAVPVTYYRITVMRDGRPTRAEDHRVTGGTYNLNTATPITTSPVVAAATGDTVYLRTDAGNTNLAETSTFHFGSLNLPGSGGIVIGGTSSKQISGGPEKLSFQDTVANRVSIANFVGTEANARFLLDLQGNHEWAGPSSTDQNVLLGWSAEGRLNLSGTSGGGLNIVRWTSPGVLEDHPRISFNNDGDGLKFSDGTAVADVQLKRAYAQGFNIMGIGAPVTVGFLQSTDSYPRIALSSADPGIKFGPGTGPADALLYRPLAAHLNVQAWRFQLVHQGESYPRVVLNASSDPTLAGLDLSDGTGAADTGVHRDSAGNLELFAANSINFLAGVLNNGGKVKHGRVAVTDCATTGCSATWSFGTAFADTNFTVSCTIEGASAQSETTGLRFAKVRERLATGVTTDLDNLSASTVSGTLHCFAIHD